MAKILILEDEKAMSDLITIKFKVEGFEVDQVTNVAEARAKLNDKSSVYNAILTDYLLPDGNSIDFISSVRDQAQYKNLPIVVMTNYIEDISADRLQELYVNKIIVKYQSVPAQMVEIVKQLIGVPLAKSDQGEADSKNIS